MERCKQNIAEHDQQTKAYEDSLRSMGGDLETLRLGTIINKPVTEEELSRFRIVNLINHRFSHSEAATDRRRQEKWLTMIEKLKSNKGLSRSTLKKRARKGIPTTVRGEAWPILAEANSYIPKEFKDDHKPWIAAFLDKDLSRDERECILKDVPRTASNLEMFSERDGPGQRVLFGCLKCVALLIPETGYVQGMNYIVSTLMTATTADNCILMMLSLLKNQRYQQEPHFQPNFPGLEFSIYVQTSLMQKTMAPLHEHLIEEGFIPQLYCCQWHMTLFASYFPLDVVLRIWDVYFTEGRKTIIRVSLAILKINEQKLLAANMIGMKKILQEYAQEAKIDQLFQVAFNSFKFSKSKMEELQTSFAQNKDVNKDLYKLAKLLN